MTTETPEAPIFRLTAEIERLQQVCGRWQTNSIETWSAMQAMRNDINVHVPMPSMEGDLLQGPESSVFCAAVAESVVTGIERLTSERDAALARESALLTVMEMAKDYIEDAASGALAYRGKFDVSEMAKEDFASICAAMRGKP